MPSKERNEKIDSFLDRADALVQEVIATFENPEQAEARWRQSREYRRRG